MRNPLPLWILLGIAGFVFLGYVSATARPTTKIAAAPEKPTAAPGDPLAEPPTTEKPTPAAPPQAPVSINRGAVKACFNECLKKDPKCGGKITTTVTIDETGKATTAVSESTDAPASLVGCIRKSFLAMKYAPAEAGGTKTVTVPVTLHAAQ